MLYMQHYFITLASYINKPLTFNFTLDTNRFEFLYLTQASIPSLFPMCATSLCIVLCLTSSFALVINTMATRGHRQTRNVHLCHSDLLLRMGWLYYITTWRNMTTNQYTFCKLQMYDQNSMPCVISLFSRIFTVDQVKESATHESDGPAVHWLNAMNPDLFSEQVLRYVKYILTQAHIHARSGMLSHHTHLHPLYSEPYVCV